MLNYASSTSAHCSTNVLGRGKRGEQGSLPNPSISKDVLDVPTSPGSTYEVLPPACCAQPWPRAGTPQGSSSLSVRQAMHRLRSSTKAQSPLSSVSQHSLVESEGHPVSRINFALWCQSRVVQFIMGFNPCYRKCK